MSVTAENPIPDKTLDVKGLLCPIPVMKTFQAIQKLAVGQILEVLATDPASKPDMDAWSKKTGHSLLKIEDLPENPPVFRFLIRKTK